VRVDWLRSVGGLPVKDLSHHCVDTWLACMAARHEKEINMCGILVDHFGGGSSTKPAYREAAWLQQGSLEGDHRAPHLFLYNEFRDVLPIEI